MAELWGNIDEKTKTTKIIPQEYFSSKAQAVLDTNFKKLKMSYGTR